MLIIPVENRPDWKNPPLATLLLILVNVLVFFCYQGRDPDRLEESWHWYMDSGLAEREQQPFHNYLKTLPPEAAPPHFTLPGAAQFQYAAYDRAFGAMLHQQLDGDVQWRANRSRFDDLLDTVSTRAYAFHPQDMRPVTWFTNMFLHGSLMHLLGNMVFLFLFGFALEIAIGRGTFLLLYLCSGLGGTLLYWASEMQSSQGILGASGAISGLMGMYIALYGMKKINFFYNVIFFTGQLRAPALIIFPVWVGYELIGAYYSADNVGHWAHTGGLLFGFVLLALWIRFGLAVDRNYVEKIDPDAPFKAALARIQQLTVALKLDAARLAAQALVKAHPRDARAWRSLYGVVKISPASREYHRVVHSLFKRAGAAAREPALQTLIEEVAHEYTRIGGPTPALTESTALMLAPRLGRIEHIKPLAHVVDRLLALDCHQETMPGVLQAAANLSARAALQGQAEHYREQLQMRFPDSNEARQVAALAPA
jgi:membrane associated rhomboid family serine protease